MKEIELYDIIALNNLRYAVLRGLKQGNDRYYLLSQVDEEDNPSNENLKIVVEQQNGDKIELIDVTDEKKLETLTAHFIKSLDKNL
jgi:hypothetical protein